MFFRRGVLKGDKGTFAKNKWTIKMNKCENVWRNLADFLNSERIPKVQKACNSCGSRQELSNEYFLANIGFDTAENGPLKVSQKFKISQTLEKSWNNRRVEPTDAPTPEPTTEPTAAPTIEPMFLHVHSNYELEWIFLILTFCSCF